MANQKHADGADLWFVTAEGSGKLRDIAQDPHINLAYYKSVSYEWVSASGVARVSKDRAKIRELYEPDWKLCGRRPIPVTVRRTIPAWCSSRLMSMPRCSWRSTSQNPWCSSNWRKAG